MAPLEQSRRALSVLIVEDDREALRTIGVVIGKKFPELLVRSAGHGQGGVELCREQTPDIVVTDINMAGMNGLQMAGEIQALKADVRFIVLTGYSDREHLDKFSELGAIDYLVKPVNFKKLFSALGKCIDQIRQREDPDGC